MGNTSIYSSDIFQTIFFILGVITTNKQLDYETATVHVLKVEVTDQSANTLNRKSSILTLTVNVGDILDSLPNTEPGEVVIGDQGTAIPSLTAGNTWKMPVRVNPGSDGIQAIHALVEFDTNAVELTLVETKCVHDVNGNTLEIFSPVNNADAKKTDVAMVSFKALKTGTPTITLKAYHTVNRNLVSKPTIPATACSSYGNGDMNQDCKFNIIDVAFIGAYYLSAQSGFPGDLGTKMKSVTTAQKTAMDVDFSQAIDEDDSKILALIYLEKAMFISDLTIAIPNHNITETCELSVQVKLKSKSGQEVDSSKTQVFLDIAHTTAVVHTQVHETTLIKGTKAATKNNQTFFGGILKTSYDSQTKAFTVSSDNSKLSGTNIGISMIQVVTKSTGQQVISPMFKAPKTITYQSGLDINLDTNLRFQYKDSYSAQRMINFEETTERCKDPYVIDTIELTFEGDYDTLTKGGKDALGNEITKALKKLNLAAEFTCHNLREGSIIATLSMKTIQSERSDVTASLYNHVVSGITVTHNGETIVTKPHMTVGGKEYVTEKKIENDGLTTTHIIIIVVSVLLLLVMIIAIILFIRYRKNKKIVQSPPSTPDNCWDHEDMEMKKHNAYMYEVNSGYDKGEDAQSIESVDAAVQVF